jgi:hypothetical protein
MKKSIIYILFLFIIISGSAGQDVKVTATLDTSRIFIGDQIKLSLTVTQPASVTLTLPELRDTVIKNIDIIKGPETDTLTEANGNLIISRKYLITSFDSGRYQIRPFFAELKGAEGIKRFYSDYTYLEVLRPDVAPADSTAKIYDIVGPYKAPITFGEILPWILFVLLAGAIGYLVYKYVRKFRRQASDPEIIVLKDPPHVIAFRELEQLKEEKLWQKGEVKLYYSRLTEILRKYLESRYSVYSLELTTSETLDALLKTGIKKGKEYDDLKSVLSGADMVKFAKYNPEPSENESYYQTAWTFVTETKEAESASTATVSEEQKGGSL